MELERSLIKEKAKRALRASTNSSLKIQKSITFFEDARSRMQEIFDHQYEEFISGLKATYPESKLFENNASKSENEEKI